MSELTVGPATRVRLHFALKLETGEVIDSNFDGEPASFEVGDGSLLTGFEQSLFGLQAGQRRSQLLPPEKAFGQPNPNNIQCVPRSSFSPGFELREGLVVAFSDASGGETPAVVQSVDDRDVYVDFNHPLAGKSILFEALILSVSPAATH